MKVHSKLTGRGEWAAVMFGVLAVMVITTVGCTPQTRSSKSHESANVTTTGKTMEIDKVKVDVPTAGTNVTADDIKYASYGVLHNRGGAQQQSIYRLAYVKKGADLSILAGKSGFEEVELTSSNMPARVEDYLHMGPIVAIVGDRRQFTVGQTYDSVISEPKLGPNFKFVCDREEEIAGIHGYHLTVTSQRSGKTEMEMILSPNYPFPLYVREYVGSQPLQFILVSTQDSVG
jgi:hypothetical protein